MTEQAEQSVSPLVGHDDIDDVIRRIESGETTVHDAAKVEELVDELREYQAIAFYLRGAGGPGPSAQEWPRGECPAYEEEA